jgi:hypothetical protein
MLILTVQLYFMILFSKDVNGTIACLFSDTKTIELKLVFSKIYWIKFQVVFKKDISNENYILNGVIYRKFNWNKLKIKMIKYKKWMFIKIHWKAQGFEELEIENIFLISLIHLINNTKNNKSNNYSN